MSSPTGALTTKQRVFVEVYLSNGFNAGAAAREAGYSGDDRALRVIGAKNLVKPNVRAVVEDRLKEHKLTADEVLARLAEMARGTIEDFIDPDSGVFDLKKAAKARRLHLIKKIKQRTIISNKDDSQIDEVEVELYDAQKALIDLGRHLKLFTDNVNITGQLDVSKLSDEELRAIVEGRR